MLELTGLIGGVRVSCLGDFACKQDKQLLMYTIKNSLNPGKWYFFLNSRMVLVMPICPFSLEICIL